MKVRSIIVFVVIVILFLLVGCQTKSSEPVKVEIIRPSWEYKELSISCDFLNSEEKPPCHVWGYEKDTYPDRVSILNNYGKLGWEVINEIGDGASVHFLLKRLQ